MKKAFRHIANFSVVLLLLLSTTGMTVYKLHCDCLHHEHISVFIEPASCHTADSPECCAGEQYCTHTSHQQEDQPCSECDTHQAFFFKLDTSFLSQDFSFNVSPVQLKVISVLFAEILNWKDLVDDKTFAEIIDSPPPFIDSGKKIITLFHQFKFDMCRRYI